MNGEAFPLSQAVPYRVLARKYRPQSFDDLIGQDVMVRILSNAFQANRIPQAWMLTGVRGVGKTTTARILARGLNYESADGSSTGPTVQMPELGVHCQAIMESRHVDVLEMDAASHTGIDDVRQITDSVRYAPVSARMKVYIIDEVHMLSEKAFNAFLKTLEEPPSHAKFVFATTEIRKVPVTILSRCQRFDLRRVESEQLIAHLQKICRLEEATATDEALALIARAAEGSVRDALSLLDQAISYGAGRVDGNTVRAMLGLADRSRVIDLFEAAMRGDLASALKQVRDHYDSGADPAAIVMDLCAFTHLVTRMKLAPGAAADSTLSEGERVRGLDFAERLSIRTLSMAWQMLNQALGEVQTSSHPIAAAEMALVRLAYAADLPTPDEALRLMRGPSAERAAAGLIQPRLFQGPGGQQPLLSSRTAVSSTGSSAVASTESSLQPDPQPLLSPPALRLARFEDLIALAGEKRDLLLKSALERDIHLVHFEDGLIEFALASGGSRSFAGELGAKLQDWTGRRWLVAVSSQAGAPTVQQASAAVAAERRTGAEAHPLVQATLARFPGARIVDVRDRPEVVHSPEEGFSDLNPEDAND